MTETPPPVLEIKGLVRRYATLVALGELDLEVDEGEFVALVGPNGAGKSTLLACVAGLLEPSEGEVRVAGATAGSLPARAATSYLGDEPVLYDDLSLEEHLEYVARLHGLEDWERPAADLVTRLGLDERVDDLPAHFSKGMRQKTSIALGLLRPFELLLADEPFDGLDPPSREVLTDLLTEAAASGAAVIVSTHRLDIAERASRCIALFDGKVTHDGPADEATMHETPALTRVLRPLSAIGSQTYHIVGDARRPQADVIGCVPPHCPPKQPARLVAGFVPHPVEQALVIGVAVRLEAQQQVWIGSIEPGRPASREGKDVLPDRFGKPVDPEDLEELVFQASLGRPLARTTFGHQFGEDGGSRHTSAGNPLEQSLDRSKGRRSCERPRHQSRRRASSALCSSLQIELTRQIEQGPRRGSDRNHA